MWLGKLETHFVVGLCLRSMLSECALVRCIQAVKQTMSSLTSQHASMTEQVSKLQQQRPAASQGSDDSSGDSAFKQRLRKIEITVAGETMLAHAPIGS